MLLLAAEGAGLTIENVMPALSSVSSVGFAIWFAYHTATVAMPKQQAEHREAIKELTTTHAQTIRDIVDEMKEHREAFDRWKQGGH